MFGYHLFCWKLKIKKKKFPDYCSHQKNCSFVYLHCSCPMNIAIGTGQKKKKKKPKASDMHRTWSKRILSVTWTPYQETIKSLRVVKHVYSLFFPIDEYFSFILIRGLLRFTVIENLIVPFMNWLCKLGFIVKMFVSITLS